VNKFLLDANLSPRTKASLSDTFHFDVTDLQSQQQGTLPDDEVVLQALREGRIIITFDKDFGEIYYLRERGKVGVIVLRIEDQTVESVNKSLYTFFSEQAKEIDLTTSLVIIAPNSIRVMHKEKRAA
jgi:predicted nuclease of predicted toxin-antitoxin system